MMDKNNTKIDKNTQKNDKNYYKIHILEVFSYVRRCITYKIIKICNINH